MKRRVLHLTTCLEPGGAEQMLLGLVRGLVPFYDLTVAYLSGPGTLSPAFTEIGVKVVPIRMKRKFDLAGIGRLFAILRHGRFDLVHTHLLHAGLLGRPLARLAGVPVVIHTQHNTLTWESRSRIVDLANRASLHMADRIIAVGEAVAEKLHAHAWIRRRRIEKIFNGVDIKRFRPGAGRSFLSRTLNIPADVPVIGVIAGFRPEKGHDVILAAMELVLRALPQARLLLVGSGPLSARINRTIVAQGLADRVVIAGARNDVEHLLPGCDVVALPSWQEGIPVSALEAMACSIPVVATRVGGTPEVVVNGRNGLLVPPGDPKALAHALLRILQHPDYGHTLGKEGRETVTRKFDITTMIEKTEALYQKLLARKGVSRVRH